MNIIELIDVYTSNFVKEQGTLLLSYTLITIIYYLVEVVGISYIVNNLKDKKTYKRLKKVSLVILLCVAIFFYIKGMVENKLSSALSLNSRQKLFTSIIDRYKESYKDIKIGGVVTRIYNITYDFRLAILNFLKYIFPTMLVLLISVALVFRVDKKVGYLLAACLFTTCIICYYGYLNIRESKRVLENSFYRNIDSLVNKYQNLLNSYINNETVHDKKRVTTQQANYSKDILRSENDNVINTSLLRANLCIFFFLIILCVCKNKESQKSIGYVSVILLYFVTNYLNFSITSSIFLNILVLFLVLQFL